MFYLRLVLLLLFINSSEQSHFRGGTISYAPVNPYDTGSSVQIAITTRFFWNINTFAACNQASDVPVGALFGDSSLLN